MKNIWYFDFYRIVRAINCSFISLLIILFEFQVVDFLIDPFVAGTSAADPESLVVSNVSDPLLPVKSHARYTGSVLFFPPFLLPPVYTE